MDNNINNQPHNHSVLYIALGSSLGGGFLLLFALGLMFMTGGIKAPYSSSNLNSQQAISRKPTVTSVPKPTAVPIFVQNKKDLDEALKMYDNQAYAADSEIQSTLDQNSKDVSSFSQ